MRWRGERFSNVPQIPPESVATSTLRYTVSLSWKSYVSGSPPALVSPTPTLKTPFATVTIIDEGVPAGQSWVPDPTVGESYKENLKQYGVPLPPRRLPLASISLP